MICWMKFALGVVLVGMMVSCAPGQERAQERATTTSALAGNVSPRFEWQRRLQPESSLSAVAAYDRARARLVYLAGQASDPQLDIRDLYEQDRTGAWFERTTPSSGPTARFNAGMAYDSQRQRVMLFGGSSRGGRLRELWEWDGFEWTSRTPAQGGPSARSDVSVAYDRARGRLVVFGGATATGLSNELWEWDGERWIERSDASGPTPRYESAMTYDDARQRIVLVGGMFAGGVRADDLWEWDGVSWQLRETTNAPPPSYIPRIAYDEQRQRTVMIQGFGTGAPVTETRTWEWDGQTWTSSVMEGGPGPGSSELLTYDARVQRVVRVGDATVNDRSFAVWEWDGTIWHRQPAFVEPPSRYLNALVTDPDRDVAVMFGGVRTSALGDTWTWDGARWTELDGAGPPPRWQPIMGYDAARREMVMFGGGNSSTQVHNLTDTWVLRDGVWSERTPTVSPPTLIGARMHFDPVSQVLLMVGGLHDGQLNDRVWAWDGSEWSERTPTPNPLTSRYRSAIAEHPTRHRLVLFGGIGTTGQLDDLWEWSGTQWSSLEAGDLEKPSRDGKLFVHPTYDTLMFFAGHDSNTASGPSQLWELDTEGSWRRQSLRTRSDDDADGFLEIATAGKSVLLFGGMTASISYVVPTHVLTDRGAPCASAAESTTGFCVDGVSCVSSSCVACETCADPRDPGRCMPVRGEDDADSCSRADGHTCDANGVCRLMLGAASADPAACVSGFVSDGVCCEVAECGSCQTCNAANKEIPDNDGHCGTQRAGLDLRDDCAASEVTSCGLDGSCDGRGRCRNYSEGTACGPVSTADATVSARVCSGEGTCRVALATCDGDHSLLVPGHDPIDCGAYRCEGASCKQSCNSISDCAAGFVCDVSGACSEPSTDTVVVDEGCGCQSTREADLGGVALLLAITLLLRRRGVSALATGTLCAVACTPQPPAPVGTAQQSLSGDEVLIWQQVGTPRARYRHSMFYLPARGRVQLFGGRDDSNLISAQLRDLWEWDGRRWSNMTVGDGPSARSNPAAVYDEQRQRVVLFGGFDLYGTMFDDLWEWDGQTWERRVQIGRRPAGRTAMCASYDSDRQRVVVFSGSAAGILPAETWEWDGGAWSLRATSGPAPRQGAHCVYDRARRVTVLFGGDDLTRFFGDTWEWDGTTWSDRTALSAESPAPRSSGAIAYDRARSRVVLVSGADEYLIGGTWFRDASGTWTRGPIAPQPGMLASSAAYDEARQKVVVFGGIASGVAKHNTLELDGDTWVEHSPGVAPPPRYKAAVGYDTRTRQLLLFGGGDFDVYHERDDFWAWDGRRWTALPTGPSGRLDARLVYGNDRALLVGGDIDDLWQWHEGAWTQLTPSGPSPGARERPAFTFDPQRERWVLFGGNYTDTHTWEWTGSAWEEHVTAVHPPAGDDYTFGYDPARSRAVLFSSEIGLWEWDGATWEDRSVVGGPTQAVTGAYLYDARNSIGVLAVAPGNQQGQSSALWSWNGGEWGSLRSITPARGPIVSEMPMVTTESTLGLLTAAFFRGALFEGAEQQVWELRSRGRPCTSDADATTGFCVDGVSCEVSACPGTCQACNTPDALGVCAPVRSAEDADTCGGDRMCDGEGMCKLRLGRAANEGAQCVSGFVVDGVCCETSTCDACSTCSAANKEIPDNDGRCGTQRAGLDLREDCTQSEPSLCGLDGACDGRGACRLYSRETACERDGVSGWCSGQGACEVSVASCIGEGDVRAPGGERTSCNGLRCVEGKCLSACSSVADCVSGMVCAAGACVLPSEEDSEAGGCSCRAGAVDPGSGIGALLLLLPMALRKKSRHNAAHGKRLHSRRSS